MLTERPQTVYLPYYVRDTLDCVRVPLTDQPEAHIARHNITPSEVEEAAQRPYQLGKGRNDTTLLFGQTHAGRYLVVVLSEAMDGRWYVVTARDMDGTEQQAYRRKAR
ncbi:hypothetical protein [Nocardia testacea]|uniref:hypothetical protein n=1 Tax=Nocardia testacea TaxID=248551 RepID=UPI000683FC39|nr:hypothetical protein [Nocardia testacea]